VIPFKLNDDWNLITRTIVPIIEQKDIFPGSGSQSLPRRVEQYYIPARRRWDLDPVEGSITHVVAPRFATFQAVVPAPRLPKTVTRIFAKVQAHFAFPIRLVEIGIGIVRPVVVIGVTILLLRGFRSAGHVSARTILDLVTNTLIIADARPAFFETADIRRFAFRVAVGPALLVFATERLAGLVMLVRLRLGGGRRCGQNYRYGQK
jgi:hypothetical protein